ncbi:MAG: hypothetical protein GIW99_04360 [Candidatus Eremiobacteraeota bacterium]|nr:hypothetical protein [Candidatus Eremiobacteraeota bacterium]
MTLSAQLSMLDLYSSPERFAAYGDAIAYRFPGVQPLSYAHAAEIGMPPGELGCAAWVAFESRRPLLEVATAMRRTGQTCATAPDHYGFSAESMEIAEGLLFEDYDETPSLPQQ